MGITKNKYDFEGKTVLVTGGGSGIGRSIAQAFLQNGANVIVTGRRKQKLEETVSGYPAEKTLAISNDISRPDSAQKIVSEIIKKFGRLDVVIHNAGQLFTGELQDLPDESWVQMRSVNVDSFFYLAKAVFPELKKTKGSIVATSSVSGLKGDWKQAGYNATKHAISGFVRSLALDWGEYGIRVNAVAPAYTKTAMTGYGDSGAEDAEFLKPFINRTALGRIGHPNDIAPAVLFLASPDAGYITGVILPVDGGTSASTGQPNAIKN